MKFSLFTEIQCPQDASPTNRPVEILRQAELADTLGFRGPWIVEIAREYGLGLPITQQLAAAGKRLRKD